MEYSERIEETDRKIKHSVGQKQEYSNFLDNVSGLQDKSVDNHKSIFSEYGRANESEYVSKRLLEGRDSASRHPREEVI